ncbi:MAG: metal ABC transporter substrate-binding protein, partial [bacterium]
MKNKLNFKKIIASITTFAMITTSLVGCGSSTNTNSSASSSSNSNNTTTITTTTTTSSSSSSSASSTSLTPDTKEIVCTIFPIYDWLSEIIGDDSNIELTFLMNNGVDLHSYQPGVNDIIAIQESDLFVYVGGESDAWVDALLKDDMKTLNLVDLLGNKVVMEESVEGMQSTSHDHDHDHDEEEHDHDHDHDEDEHDHDEEEHDHDEEE